MAEEQKLEEKKSLKSGRTSGHNDLNP